MDATIVVCATKRCPMSSTVDAEALVTVGESGVINGSVYADVLCVLGR